MSHAVRTPAHLILFLLLVHGLGWLAGAPRALGAPYTPHFDDLIALLAVRAASLGEDPEPASRKLEKGIQKVLTTLSVKVSTSLATDVKNLGKVAKSLKKLFPDELAATTGALPETLSAAGAGLEAEVQAIIDGAGAFLEGKGGSVCKTKTTLALEGASALVAAARQAATAGDFAGAAKSLGSALKAAVKGDVAARSTKCDVPADGGGDPGGDDPPEFLRAVITGSVRANFAALGALEATTVYDSLIDQISVIASDNAKLLGMVLAARGVTGPGTYPLHSGSSFTDLNTGNLYAIQVSGSITFNVLDFEKPEVMGTFEVTIQQYLPTTEGSITASRGRFRILKLVDTAPKEN